ncbi:MAG: ATP synthase subunit I [Deltaproteobacteria bacterium]|nr:ATP synthase subunit I [Deltaproteobacteria bacterium]
MEGDGPGGTKGATVTGIGPPRKDDGAGILSSRSLETKILLSGVVILVGIAVVGRYRMLPGAACGAAIAYGNFYLIRKILGKAFSVEGDVNKGFAVQYVLKFLALVAVVYVVVRSGRFDLLGFLLGLSALVFGVLLEGVSRAVETK